MVDVCPELGTSLPVFPSTVPDWGHSYLKVTPVCLTEVVSSSRIAAYYLFSWCLLACGWYLVL